ncbi:MAG: hypothetical protein NTZ69_15845 [Bacteroidia bacterium]|nr:hypothetical protein [Bacteroidia bacterium]
MKTYTKEQIEKAMKKAGYVADSVFKHLELSIIQRVQSFEEACDELGKSYDLPFDPDTKDLNERSTNGHYKLCVIAQALNEEWAIDLNNKKQEVWYNWVDLRGVLSGADAINGAFAGLGGSNAYNAPSLADTRLGSRLCVRSKPIAEHLRLGFIPIWCEYKIPEFEM